MLNSLEALAGKISPGSGKSSPPTSVLPSGGSPLLDANGNKVLLGGYVAAHHHQLLHAAKHPYQKPLGLSNHNAPPHHTGIVGNSGVSGGGGLVGAAALGGGGVPPAIGIGSTSNGTTAEQYHLHQLLHQHQRSAAAVTAAAAVAAVAGGGSPGVGTGAATIPNVPEDAEAMQMEMAAAKEKQ